MKYSEHGRLLIFLFAASLFLVPCGAQSSTNVSCRHFWERHGILVASGRSIGEDVGSPPDETYDKTGTYLCQMTLTRSDVLNGRYLFIGEVGDASYLELFEVNGRKVRHLPVNHGLSPNSSDEPVYTRFFPFAVSARDLFVEAGLHKFKIRYKDLFPFQVGIRSGSPTLESFSGVILRALTCSPAFTFHMIQFLVFILLAVSFASWPKLHLNTRSIFTLASLASANVVLQFTAIPRSFMPSQWATRLNDFSQILSFPILGAALLVFFAPNYKAVWRVRVVATHLIFSLLGVGTLLFLGQRNDTYLWVFGFFLLSLAGIPIFTLGYGLRQKWFSFAGGPRFPRGSSYIFMFIGLVYCFDIVNLVLLRSRFYYFNHYLFFSTILLCVWRFQAELGPNELKFRNDLEAQNKKAYAKIASNLHDEIDSLEIFTRDLAELFCSSRISIQEVVDGMLRFVGHFGAYTNIQGLHEVRAISLVAQAIETRQIQFGRMPSKTREGLETDVLIVPLENNSNVIGVLCATEFKDGQLSKFYRDRMNIIKHECEPVLALLLSERHNRSKDRLIHLVRNRTHFLQLRSEEYFLKNFDISPTIQSHAFIYGDLVGSVVLNEMFKFTNAVELAIDEHLAVIWNRFKHLGVIVSRTKGDMISFVVPNQVSDSSEKEAVARCFEILRYISLAQPELQALGKKYGISVALRYRFAMSRVERPLITTSVDNALRSFSLLVDEAIDAAARVVSGVALDGECLVMEPARNALDNQDTVLELDPQRLKGKANPVKLWSLNGNVLQNG